MFPDVLVQTPCKRATGKSLERSGRPMVTPRELKPATGLPLWSPDSVDLLCRNLRGDRTSDAHESPTFKGDLHLEGVPPGWSDTTRSSDVGLRDRARSIVDCHLP